ncbi:nitrate/nitrite transporter [Alkalicoccobacillus porphyridii]|uniref:NarK/NasA family nitrate transporter n=1 Tax=Alkalicoccobacillus porphyridii TaxID=2597270 RepID=A0A553ZYV3_9BACI|nr:nitrate/nitrite transporter [Alkalicoccobacillus porphyridii]TSB46623.1 NarK/NasA family nitrate transporter [Alkalicoccobacillus porphyridii]
MKLSDLRKSGHAPSLFSAFLYFDVSFMIWVLLGALGVYITIDFDLTASQVGLIVAIPILAGSIFRIMMGVLTDRFGPKKTSIGGMIVTMVPLAWGWLFGTTVAELYLIGILLGVAGASFSASLPMASRWYPPELQGLAMGIAGAGNSGTLFATLFGPRLAEIYGWNGVMGLALIPLSLVLISYMMMAKEPPNQPKPKPIKDYFSVFKERDTWYFCLLYSVTFGGFVGLSSFLSYFFVSQYSLSAVRAGEFVTIVVAAGSFLRPVGGYISDKIGGAKLLYFLFTGMTVCMLTVSMMPPLLLVTAALFIGMGCLGMGNGAVFQLVPQRFQKEIGMVTGIVGAAGGIGGFFLPNILGTLRDWTGTYASGFIVFACITLLSVGLLALAQASWRKEWKVAKTAQKVVQS